jgi:hypothetical protein
LTAIQLVLTIDTSALADWIQSPARSYQACIVRSIRAPPLV